MKIILLRIINLLHILLVIFSILTPFTNSNYFLILHAIIIPFIILHWLFNNNTCSLTLLEKTLKKEIYGNDVEHDCITCKLIEPVYDFKNNYKKFSIFIYGSSIILWLITIIKLTYKFKTGQISKLNQLFLI